MSTSSEVLESSRIQPGSPEHLCLLAQFFTASHCEYVPEKIAWPALSPPELERLRRLPFWQEAVATESATSSAVTAGAALEPHAAVRKAIELQGFEERRHARLLSALTTHYRIPIVPPVPLTPSSLENDLLFAGFGECFDSFFAFGLFALARSSGYFPAALVCIFEPVMEEEARHILFFVNWVKARRAKLPWWRRPQFSLRCGWIILRQVASRVVKTARSLGGSAADSGDNFTLTAHEQLAESITLHALLGTCLAENDRRMGRYDARLSRPRLVPGIARALYRLLPASL